MSLSKGTTPLTPLLMKAYLGKAQIPVVTKCADCMINKPEQNWRNDDYQQSPAKGLCEHGKRLALLNVRWFIVYDSMC